MPSSGYQICTRCIMDTSDPDIVFDAAGVCNHCQTHREKRRLAVVEGDAGRAKFAAMVEQVRAAGRRSEYDCVLGVSGGIDSAYLALLAKRHGLRPLLVHLDNGWNAEVSVANIKRLVTGFGFDLHTHVIDWNEFRSLQKAFFAASVVDIEMLTDHAIKAVVLRQAVRHGVKHVLSGGNVVTEAIMPVSWRHAKSDLRNIKSILRRHGPVRRKTYPTAGTLKQWFVKYARGVRTSMPLNWVDYDPRTALEELEDEVGFRPYGKKHTESVFTRFYQGHILPVKFGIDKRRPHLSSLVCSGFLSRDEALAEIEKPPYDARLLAQDIDFVEKKLGFSDTDFQSYLAAPARSHFDYASDQPLVQGLLRWKRALAPAA